MSNAPYPKLYWEDKYEQGDDRWSLDSPNPELVRLINSGEIVPSGKICVIGSGKGYDAIFAADAGFSVTAMDISAAANKFAENLAKEKALSIDFVECDLLNIPPDFLGVFDYVFEYVTFCAFKPNFLPELIESVFSLLKSGGRLISILFPVDGRSGGPPFNIEPEKFLKIASEFAELRIYETQIDSVKPRRGSEMLIILEKK